MILTVTSALCAQEPEKQQPKLIAGAFKTPALTYQIPSTWKLQKSRSTMRLATWALPGKGAVNVVAFWFGKGGGGTREDNLKRWKDQIDGDPKPVTRKLQVAKGIVAHVIDTTGTYVAPLRPGSPKRNNKPDHRLIGAYVTAEGGPLYIKVIGPSKTVSANDKAIEAFIKSLRFTTKK